MNVPVTLYLVIPCYNEESVLPITSKLFLQKINQLTMEKKISTSSGILFVNDGSQDGTWEVICRLSKVFAQIKGMCLSANAGHQNALLSGLLESINLADVVISMDCDGQDDIDAIDEMLEKYYAGCDVVYGVRNDRTADSLYKKLTAEGFYKVLSILGGKVVFNHADYRLMSKKALQALAQFREVNLFLRGLVPMIGLKTGVVYYKRARRMAGDTHYPLKRMLALALEGITSLSIKPIRFITMAGVCMELLTFIGIGWIMYEYFNGNTVSGWASIGTIVLFLGGVQLFCLGILGEYIGKIYLETKARPRYIISERTWIGGDS